LTPLVPFRTAKLISFGVKHLVQRFFNGFPDDFSELVLYESLINAY
jgi:hypothetical protein